jgi:hypothetical protein
MVQKMPKHSSPHFERRYLNYETCQRNAQKIEETPSSRIGNESRASGEMEDFAERITFSLVARSSGLAKAASSRATQESTSEMVSGRVYGWRFAGGLTY